MSFRIRRATLDDCRQIPAIERAAAARFRGASLDWLADADPNSDAFIAACRRHGEVLIAASDDVRVGFALAGTMDSALHIYEISVLPEFGRRGAGRQLIDALADAARARGLASLTLATFADIAWNGPFYAGLGFVVIDAPEWTPGMHLLRGIETALQLPIGRRQFMRWTLG